MAKDHYAPKFHKDETVSFWVDKSGGYWMHRVHPKQIYPGTVAKWEPEIRKRYDSLMQRIGYQRERGVWVYVGSKERTA